MICTRSVDSAIEQRRHVSHMVNVKHRVQELALATMMIALGTEETRTKGESPEATRFVNLSGHTRIDGTYIIENVPSWYTSWSLSTT